MNIKISQAYDICTAVLTDHHCAVEDTSIKFREDSHKIEYKHPTNGTLTLCVVAPHGAPVRWQGHKGYIIVYNNNFELFTAYTDYNVGRAFVVSRYNPMFLITRALSRKFFKILDLANARSKGKVIPTDNTIKIQQCIQNFEHKQK